MTVLVTGGGGYIGSHVVRLLQLRGEGVVVIDDFVTGNIDRIPGVPVVTLDLATESAAAHIRRIVEEYDVDSVIHFAARKQIAESVERPAWYFLQNVGSLTNVLLGIEHSMVRKLVFSSSAAVYGSTNGGAILETDLTDPISPYGATKLVGEQLVTWSSEVADWRAVSLRYFNVVGAGWPELGDTMALNLVPMVFERIDRGLPPLIFGDDYPTPDGTCIRDFVHVQDLAEAHLAALDFLETSEKRSSVFNVGTGTGTSVKQVVKEISRVTGFDSPAVVQARRRGDAAEVVASVRLIEEKLGWRPRFDLGEIIDSSWESHQRLRSNN